MATLPAGTNIKRPSPWQSAALSEVASACLKRWTIGGGLVWLLLVATRHGDSVRTPLAMALSLILLTLVLLAPRAGLALILIYLGFLGGLRRWLIPALGWAPSDPLLLVSPLVAGAYFAILLLGRQIDRDSRLSRLLLWLLGVMVFEIANPQQGGLAVGMGGALFFIAPVLWYFVGRHVGEPAAVARLFRVTVPLAILAALYGLRQTWFGFLPSEEEWLRMTRVTGYLALRIYGATRAFSFFPSSAEYTHFVGLGLVLLWAAWLRGHRLAILPVPLLALAIFLSSQRGAVLAVLGTCAVLWAVQGSSARGWGARWLVGVAVAAGALAWGLPQLQDSGSRTPRDPLIEHQVSGLLNPLDPERSTARGHAGMVGYGLVTSLRSPLGHGLGSTTLAAARYGGAGVSMEYDAVDVFFSTGWAGGLLYLAIIASVLVGAFRYWQETRTLVSLGILGVLIFGLGRWLHGGQYCVSTLTWLCIGALERGRTGESGCASP